MTPFADFDWYDREDVQAARLRARHEGASSIDARHLLLGFLATTSGTRSVLRDELGEEGFDRLVRTAEKGNGPVATPGIETFFSGSERPGGASG